MKKHTWVVLLFLNFALHGIVFPQGFYYKAGAGYNTEWPNEIIAENSLTNYYLNGNSYSSTEAESVEIKHGSYVNGMTLDGAVGYSWKTFGVEVGLSYLPESSVESSVIINDYTTTPSYMYKETGTNETSLFTVTPSFVLFTDIGLYGRAGVIFGIPFVNQLYTIEDGWTNEVTQEKIDFRGNIAFGFSGGVGLAMGSDAIKFFIEADFNNLTWACSRSEITKYTVNGVDELPTMTTSQKVTNYVASYNTTSSNPNDPSTHLEAYMPLSAFGVKAGIAIGF
ncbi:MAG: hypothetical protein WAV76_05305 [Bacteroidota bacterium]